MAHQQAVPPVLAILGGEGLRTQAAAIWQQILQTVASEDWRAVVIQAVSDDHPAGTRERRARLIVDTLQKLGLLAEVLSLTGSADTPSSIAYFPVMYLTGDTRTLCERLAGSELWASLRANLPDVVIAAGSAAVALGDQAFVPVKPYPAALDSLEFELLPGLGLLEDMIVMPYFAWLPNDVISRIRALSPSDATLVGIDDQAALIAQAGRWRVEGLGSISVFRPGQPPRLADAGLAVPEDLLPLLNARES